VNQVRVIGKMRERFLMGVDTYGRAKLGYHYQPLIAGRGKIQTPHSYNAPIIGEALRQYAYGKLTSAKQVKEYLDAKGIVHEEGKRHGQKRITGLSTVRNMLDNAFFYAGFIKNEKNGFDLRPGIHQSIIDMDTYEAILERMGKRNNFYQKATELDYPLKGWLHCSECDHALTSNGKGSRGSGRKRYHYYYCRNKDCWTYKKGRPAAHVHQEFEGWLWENKCSPEILKACEAIVVEQWKVRVINKKMRASKAKQELRDVEHRITQCTNQLISHSESYVIDNLKNLLKELTAEKVKLEAQIAQKPENDYDIEELVDRVNWLLGSPLTVWQKGDIHIKRCLLNLLFSSQTHFVKMGNLPKTPRPAGFSGN
jgi:hypothetical protein